MQQPNATNPLRGRLLLLLIALITFGPFGFAWYLAKHPTGTPKTNNYGDFIAPPRPSQWSDVAPPPGVADMHLDELKGRWVLVQFVPQGHCDEACRAALKSSRQVWLRLNKDLSRVRRLLLVDGSGSMSDDAALAAWREEDPTLLIAVVQGGLRDALVGTARPEGPGGTLWLVDPLGNLMMRYPVGFEPRGLLRDLTHLLRISQIG